MFLFGLQYERQMLKYSNQTVLNLNQRCKISTYRSSPANTLTYRGTATSQFRVIEVYQPVEVQWWAKRTAKLQVIERFPANHSTYRDASFAESFYGLQRVEGDKQISTKIRYWSLFCLVGLPYIAHKTEKYISTLQNQKVAVCHKTLLASWKTVSLVQYLLYLTGQATAHSPLLTVANLNLQYCLEQPQVSTTWTECFANPKSCMRMVSNGLTQGLELGAFFLQCLQCWHSDESSGKLASAIVPPPPPVTYDIEESTSTSTVCPLCHQPCRIETALSTSGYVFCFRCIREAVSADQKCPITGLPTTVDQLVRLYPSTDT